jgi:hypothetical protein
MRKSGNSIFARKITTDRFFAQVAFVEGPAQMQRFAKLTSGSLKKEAPAKAGQKLKIRPGLPFCSPAKDSCTPFGDSRISHATSIF